MTQTTSICGPVCQGRLVPFQYCRVTLAWGTRIIAHDSVVTWAHGVSNHGQFNRLFFLAVISSATKITTTKTTKQQQKIAEATAATTASFALLWWEPLVTGGLSAVMWKVSPCHATIMECSWWRYQMEKLSALQALCVGNSPVTDEFPAQRPVTRGFDIFFALRPNQRLSKQSWGWWFETSSRALWRHCNVLIFVYTGRCWVDII